MYACVCMFALVLVLAQYLTVVFRHVHLLHAQVTDHRDWAKYGSIAFFCSLCVRQAPNHITSIVLLAFSFGFFLRKNREFSPLSPHFSHIIIVYFYSSKSRIISISSLNTSVYIFICSIFLSLSVSISVPFTRLFPSSFCYFHFLSICFVSAASMVFVVVLVTVTGIDIGL